MRPWIRWIVASFVPLVCLAALLVTPLTGQETGSAATTPQTEPPTAGGGAGMIMGTGTGMRQLSPGFAAPPWQGVSPIPGGMPSGMSPGMMSGPMMGISPDPLAQEVLVAQWQVDQALARYQQTEDETERQAIKAALTTALERQFEIQQQRRMNELAEIESRVQKLRELIDKRNRAKQAIVSKRCDQLLSELDGLGWISPAEGVPPAGSEGMPGMGMGARNDGREWDDDARRRNAWYGWNAKRKWGRLVRHRRLWQLIRRS